MLPGHKTRFFKLVEQIRSTLPNLKDSFCDPSIQFTPA